MKIKDIINQDFMILSSDEFSNLKQFPNQIILIKDDSVNYFGAIVHESGEIFDVGAVSIEALNNHEEQHWATFKIWVVIDTNNKVVGWFDKASIYQHYCQLYKSKLHFYEKALECLPTPIRILDNDRNLIFQSNLDKKKIIEYRADKGQNSFVNELLQSKENKYFVSSSEERDVILFQSNFIDDGTVLGVIELEWKSDLIERIAINAESYANLAYDLKAVFENSYDVIYVSDGEGMTLRVSSACEDLWGLKAENLIGRNVKELEKEGIYSPSVTRLVIERKEQVHTIQTTKTGKRLRVVGTPIKDDTGKVVRIINTSRDITLESIIQAELVDIRMLVEGYKKELYQLREHAMENDQLVYKSEQMINLITLVNKVTEVDSTVLILGESGAGKEVIASYIHHNSVRKNKPFIKVNCGAIPEHLLESELFGYEKGAFTGASKDGKMGLFELANNGSLLLDEIGELPMALQVKLLRILQDNELVRVGGTKSVKINVRIITATNRDLELLMKQGKFREDLYYRLNVIPLYVLPLRARKDDIIPLALHFLNRINKKYDRTKTLSNKTIECLHNYSWPGNVRELQNILERLVVITDSDIIEPIDLPMSIRQSSEEPSGVSISGILPFKVAVEQLERQLLIMAKEKYKTTTKMAEILGLDQTTISRKLKRFR